MAHSAPSPDHDARPTPLPGAAQQVADSLRRHRLTLLYGAAGNDPSSLLAAGVLPLLRRRASDKAASRHRPAPSVARPARDRRAIGLHPSGEMVVHVDDWRESPLTRLHDGVDAALRAAGMEPEWHRERLNDRLQSLADRFDMRFLIVLGGLGGAPGTTGDDEPAGPTLIDVLAPLFDLPVPAHVVIGLPSGAEGLVAPLRARGSAVPTAVFVLDRGEARPVELPPPAAMVSSHPSHAAPIEHPSGTAPHPRPWADEASTGPEDLRYTRVRREAANTGRPTEPGALGSIAADAATPVDTSTAGAPMPAGAPNAPRHPARRRGVLVAVALVATAVGALVLTGSLLFDPPWSPAAPARDPAATAPVPPSPGVREPREITAAAAPVTVTPPTPAPPTTPPEPSAPFAGGQATPTTGLTLRIADDGAGWRLPNELAKALSTGGTTVRVASAAPQATGEVATPALLLLRYDALQAAAQARPRRALGVIAPLYTDEIQVVVRADSPLRFLHQLEGRRINVGEPQEARAITGEALYRQMFGRSLRVSAAGRVESRAALWLLASGAGLDAVVLVAPGPAQALTDLPPEERRQLRLLELAPDHQASRRALRTYLPSELREPGGPAVRTLAALTFLVVDGPAASDQARQLEQVATSFCRELPALQREGDAKWRTVSPGLQLDTGWPVAQAAAGVQGACGEPTQAAAREPVGGSSGPPRN